MKKILRNKKGVALESAIIFMVTIFTFCFLLSTLAIINSNQLRIEKIYTNNDYEVEQIGEYFLSYVNKAEVTTETAFIVTSPESDSSESSDPESDSSENSDPESDSNENSDPESDSNEDSSAEDEQQPPEIEENNQEANLSAIEPEEIRTTEMLLSPLSETQTGAIHDNECIAYLQNIYGSEEYTFAATRFQERYSPSMRFELKVMRGDQLVLHIVVTKTVYPTLVSTINQWIIN